MIRIKAPAKVNLCLNIQGKRPDGYHELETVMQTIEVHDLLTIEKAACFSFNCSDPRLRDNNLVVRAARAFFHALGRPAEAAIELDKHIPHGAGLGGGSSDAAAALLGLNQLYAYPFSHQRLWELACPLGADVPFFLTRGTALCCGIGQIVYPWPDFPLGNYLLVKPPYSLSTARVFAALNIKSLQFKQQLSKIHKLSLTEFKLHSMFNNDLERPVLALYPELDTIKQEIRAAGAEGVVMSGSGSTVFGVFADQEMCKKAAEILAANNPGDWWIAACRGTNAEF